MSYTRTTAGLRDAGEYGYGPQGPHAFSAQAHVESPRAQLLARRASYFRNRQHDDKAVTWDNHAVPPFQPGHTPMLSMSGLAEMPYYTPLYQRRPGAPYRLPRLIVRGFTTLVFGEGRFPKVEVKGDAQAEDWLAAVVEAAEIPEKLEHARDVGGACGSAALSWRFWDGTPRVQVHFGGAVVVQEWADRERLIPAVATELLMFSKQEWDPKAKAYVPVTYWRRRDWTPVADVVFVDLRAGTDEERDVGWTIDAEQTCVHGEGEAHLIWVQNRPDFDGSEEDGEADYDGLLEDCDSADMVMSVLAHGGAKNLDPTLLLKIEEAVMKRASQIQKGSEHAIWVGKDGDAKYLEVAGTSISAGVQLVEKLRQVALECAQVVAHDPDRLSAATNASALKLLHFPMISVGNGLRGTYGRALKRLLEQMLRSARAHLHPDNSVELEGKEEISDEAVQEPGGGADASEGGATTSDGPEAQGEAAEPEGPPFLRLPPRLVEEPALDPVTGEPTAEKVQRWVERDPGVGGEVALVWPEWFEPTPADKQAALTSLVAANGGAAVLPREMATRSAARVLGLDEDETWRLMAAQIQAEKDAQAGMFPSAGGPVDRTAVDGEDDDAAQAGRPAAEPK